jgi:hypothetical protein
MQLPTHILAGVLLQYFIMNSLTLPTWVEICSIIILCGFSHFFIDALGKITYHPPTREPGFFWLYWHVFLYAFGFFLIFLYIQLYWLGIISGLLVDLWDWYFLRNYANYTSQPEWGKKYYLHPLADKIRGVLFSGFPNLNHSRVGILPEVILYIGWLILFILTN